MCVLHFVSILLTLLISAILSNISFIKLSSLLSGYPASKSSYVFSGLDLGFIGFGDRYTRDPQKCSGSQSKVCWNKEMGSWEVAGGVPDHSEGVRHGDCVSVFLAAAGISLTFQLVQYQNQSHETTRSDMDIYELHCWPLNWAKQMRAWRILQAPARQGIVCAPSARWLAESSGRVLLFLLSLSRSPYYVNIRKYYNDTALFYKVQLRTTK